MILIGKTRLEVNSAATFFLLSNISLEDGIVGPSVRQRGFWNHAYGMCRLLKLACFVHFDERSGGEL